MNAVKDWKGNGRAAFSIIGARNYAQEDREVNDFYATDPKAMQELLDRFTFNNRIWEPSCGEGHLSKVLIDNGYDVLSTDLIDRGYGIGGVDFFDCKEKWDGDIVTNPPYKFANEYTEHALDLLEDGNHLAMLLKLTFLETKGRKKLFDKYPPKHLYVFSGRINCAKNGDFDSLQGSPIAYGWYIWEKGFKGEPTIRWI